MRNITLLCTLLIKYVILHYERTGTNSCYIICSRRILHWQDGIQKSVCEKRLRRKLQMRS